MREPICLVWLRDRDRDGFVVEAAAFPEYKSWDLTDVVVTNGTPHLSKFLHRSEPFTCADIAQLDGHPYRDIVRPWGWTSVLATALMVRGQPIGFLEVYSLDEVRSFTTWHCQFFKTFAAQAAIAIENVISRNRLRQLNALIERMADMREVDEVLHLLYEGAISLTGCRHTTVSKLDYKTGEQHIVAWNGSVPLPEKIKPGVGITSKAIMERRPHRVGDVHSEKWHKVYIEVSPTIQSELAVPIIISNVDVREKAGSTHGAKPVGVLNIESPTLNAFSEADEEMLWSLTRQAAFVMNRIEFDRKLAALTAFEQEIRDVQNRHEVIQRTARRIVDTLDFAYVHIALVDYERNRIKTEYVAGISNHVLAQLKNHVVCALTDKHIFTAVVRSGNIQSRLQRKEFLTAGEPDLLPGESYLCVYIPMVSPQEKRVIGVIEAGSPQTYWQSVYERDVQIMRGFADYAVRTLERADRGVLDSLQHEFTAPIAGLRNNASFLKRRFSTFDEKFIETKLDDMMADCEILVRQVKKLQYVFGLSHDTRTTSIQRVLIVRDVIIKTINQLMPLAREKGFGRGQIRYRDEDIPKMQLYVDREKLNQIVYNLLTNAIKYAGDNPSAYAIAIEVDETQNEFIVCFQDEGIGIAPGLEDKIFEPHFRSLDTIKSYVTGTGLGLTIARECARELGGDLLLVHNSEPTVFHLILPKSLKERPRAEAE
jgi:signal transduction histidine kinase/putative methionine-R-sulfoxide reductase with GAF domain